VLVAWSYGGAVVCDYLRHYGTGNVGGIVFVGAISRLGSTLLPQLGSELVAIVDGLLSEGGETAVRRFVELCFEVQPSAEEFEAALAENLRVPWHVRRSLFSRELTNDDLLASLNVPVLVVHGAKDAVIRVAAAHDHAARVAWSRLVVLEDAGHSPFAEFPERFNAEIRRFCELR
jgi:non-heme chloroperoxidase